MDILEKYFSGKPVTNKERKQIEVVLDEAFKTTALVNYDTKDLSFIEWIPASLPLLRLYMTDDKTCFVHYKKHVLPSKWFPNLNVKEIWDNCKKQIEEQTNGKFS